MIHSILLYKNYAPSMAAHTCHHIYMQFISIQKHRFLIPGFQIYCNIIMLYYGQRLQITLKYEILFYVTFIEQDKG